MRYQAPRALLCSRRRRHQVLLQVQQRLKYLLRQQYRPHLLPPTQAPHHNRRRISQVHPRQVRLRFQDRQQRCRLTRQRTRLVQRLWLLPQHLWCLLQGLPQQANPPLDRPRVQNRANPHPRLLIRQPTRSPARLCLFLLQLRPQQANLRNRRLARKEARPHRRPLTHQPIRLPARLRLP